VFPCRQDEELVLVVRDHVEEIGDRTILVADKRGATLAQKGRAKKVIIEEDLAYTFPVERSCLLEAVPRDDRLEPVREFLVDEEVGDRRFTDPGKPDKTSTRSRASC